MKHFAMLLSSICLLAVPALPARASVAVDVAAVDNWHCLVLLLSDPDAHAAECGGPFTMDDGTSPLVNGNYAPCQPLIGTADLPQLEFLERVDVAQSSDDCCFVQGTSFKTIDLTFGGELLVAATCVDIDD